MSIDRDANNQERTWMKKLLYVCEAHAGGIMEYAIRQSAAIARAGSEGSFFAKLEQI